MKDCILISCIIPTFNRVSLLIEAIDSTKNQTYPHWELIIVDDGSTDNTADMVRQEIRNEPRIKYYNNSGKGGSAARNYGLGKAEGEYIAFLDDDDLHLHNRFESQLSAAIRSGSNFIVSGYRLMDRSTGRIIANRKLELKGKKNVGYPSRWFIKKELLEKVGGFNEEFPSMQEIELSIRLSEYENFAYHNDIVTIINHSPGSVSRRLENALKGKLMLVQQMEFRIHPIELANWYYAIALTNYKLGNKSESIKYLELAISRDNRCNFKIALILIWFSGWFYHLNIVNKAISFCLTMLGKYELPQLVEHKVIS